MNTLRQGDLGEASAIEWLTFRGASVYVPVGHAPDADLIAWLDGELLRIQVKTSTCIYKNRFAVALATRGGNQSWSGVAKRFSYERCDHLFVHVVDGRRWFIPAPAVEGGSGILLGGPKYERFEIDPGRPLTESPRSLSLS